MDVYYCESLHSERAQFNQLITPPITSLLEEVKSEEKYGTYLKCPAALDAIKNTYVLKSALDINVSFNHDTNSHEDVNLTKEGNDLVFSPSSPVDKHHVQIVLPGIIFFSEQPVYILTQSPYMHRSVVNGYSFMPGTFDISKWFRQIHSSFLNSTLENITIKRGEPLCYVTFSTTENIKLKEFRWTDNIDNYISSCQSYRRLFNNRALSFYYKRFIEKNFNKKIIKEIKANLL